MPEQRLTLQHYYRGRREEFIEVVHWLRENKGISHAEFVRMIMGKDVPRSTAKNWVAVGPPFSQTERFAKALGVPLTYLIMRHDITAGITPSGMELLRHWEYLTPETQKHMLSLVQTLAQQSENYRIS